MLGDLSTYPSFMKDPATEIRFVHLPEDADGKTVTRTYLSPLYRDFVALQPPVQGMVGPAANALLREREIPFFLSLIQLFFHFIWMTAAFLWSR